MAALEDDSEACSKDNSISVVLKIKRKRKAEDPASTLVIESKVKKLKDSNETGVDGMFHFCGTYNENDDYVDETVWNIVKKFQKRKFPVDVKHSALSKLSLSDGKDRKRSERKEASIKGRYKLLSSLRYLNIKENGESFSNKLYFSELFDEGKNKDTENKSEESMEIKDSASITCNSIVLEREKLNNLHADDYVYDVYMSNKCDMEVASSFDWATLSTYSYETEFVHDIIESDDNYDDEDDSNDECNWRNDYPEEENSSDLNSSVDSLEHQLSCYRYREPYYDELDYFNQDVSLNHHSESDDDVI